MSDAGESNSIEMHHPRLCAVCFNGRWSKKEWKVKDKIGKDKHHLSDRCMSGVTFATYLKYTYNTSISHSRIISMSL